MNDFQRLVDALRDIGIECRPDPEADGFIDNVRITKGVIHFKPEASLANILHEAGHLACIPPAFRSQADGDLDDLAEIMCDYAGKMLDAGVSPDAPIMRAIIQCSDGEATAWAWAFGHKLGLKPEQIIEDQDYGGHGAGVRLQVSTGMHLGINGLRAAGMIDTTKNWPHLTKWMQDAVAEEK